MLSLLGYLRDGECPPYSSSTSSTFSFSPSSSSSSSSSSPSSSLNSTDKEKEKEKEKEGKGMNTDDMGEKGLNGCKEEKKDKKKPMQVQVEKRTVTYAEWAKRGQPNPTDIVLTHDTVNRIRYVHPSSVLTNVMYRIFSLNDW